jgi:NAD(P)H-flavin reductase
MTRTLELPVAVGPIADPMVPAPYRIERVKRETHDTFTLDLAPAGGAVVQSFRPGQFNMLYVFGVGEVPISISSNPENCPGLEHTTRIVGAVTKSMGTLKRGDLVGIRGPFGSSWPVDEQTGRDFLIVAGGIGLAPLRPGLYALMREREKHRRIVLLYGARTSEDILYRRELERWRGKFDLDIQVTVDRGASGWRGNVGVVTTLVGRAPFDPTNTVALVCGPEVMMRFAIMELQKRGVDARRIFLSMERNMNCAVGFCGHCQYGPHFICKDGPVFRFDRIETIFGKPEI